MSDGPNRSLRFLERERQALRRRLIPGKLARRLWPELHHFLPDGMNRWESIRSNLVAIVFPFLGALALAWTASRLVFKFILAPMLTPSNVHRVTSGAVFAVFLVMLLV